MCFGQLLPWTLWSSLISYAKCWITPGGKRFHMQTSADSWLILSVIYHIIDRQLYITAFFKWKIIATLTMVCHLGYANIRSGDIIHLWLIVQLTIWSLADVAKLMERMKKSSKRWIKNKAISNFQGQIFKHNPQWFDKYITLITELWWNSVFAWGILIFEAFFISKLDFRNLKNVNICKACFNYVLRSIW